MTANPALRREHPAQAPSVDPDYEAIFLDQLPIVQRAIRAIGRRYRLDRDSAAEFSAWVYFRVVDTDYAPLRSYRGGSRPSTYWHAVVRNLLRDFLNRKLGKWRPSAYARRQGATAVRLETLIQRDGFAVGEAVEILQRNHGSRLSDDEMLELVASFPQRDPVRRFERVESLTLVSDDREPDDRAEDRDRRGTLRRVRVGLARALAELSDEDRRILELHFVDGLTIAAIARRLELSQRRLYARRNRCLARLRRSLDRQRIRWQDVEPLVDWEQAELGVLGRAAASDLGTKQRPPRGR